MRNSLPLASPPFGNLAILGLAMVLAACSSPTEVERLVERTDRAEALWFATRPGAYEALQKRICECTPAMAGPVRLQVTRGAGPQPDSQIETVVGAVYTENGEPVPEPHLQHFLTAQQLFELIREAVEEGAFTIEATFDPELGYPRSVSVDWDERSADEESVYQMELV